jgi:hypothetical protein
MFEFFTEFAEHLCPHAKPRVLTSAPGSHASPDGRYAIATNKQQTTTN